TESYAKRLGLPLVVIDKRRGQDGRLRIHGVIGEVEGRDVIFFDDEVITGTAILEGAAAVRERGAARVYAGCVHGSLASETVKRLAESALESVAITDTIPLAPDRRTPKIRICSVAPLFASAIRAIHDETSISALFH
ncbi:MAG: ribose-phosphate diphosphokinase, partial [Candidatus Latescibacterota bacterium]